LLDGSPPIATQAFEEAAELWWRCGGYDVGAFMALDDLWPVSDPELILTLLGDIRDARYRP
jgi:hypothetical protein